MSRHKAGDTREVDTGVTGPIRKTAMCRPTASQGAGSANNLDSSRSVNPKIQTGKGAYHLFRGFQLQDKAYGYLLNTGSPDPWAFSVSSYPYSKNGDGVPGPWPYTPGSLNCFQVTTR